MIRGVPVNLSFLEVVDGTSGVLSSVLMDGWCVGPAIGFLVEKMFLCCWQRWGWGGV